jgi:uncharacterized protein YegL
MRGSLSIHDQVDELLQGLDAGALMRQRDEAELHRQKIERFCHLFSRVNSAFTFRKVTVKVEHSDMNSPAYSGASEVTFNSRLIGDLTDAQSIAGLKGLDLHEISHILFTPREGSDIFEFVRDNNYFGAYNALEDQRIETLFTTRYPSTVDWFTSTILIHFVEKPEAFVNSYPLLRGRRYLPVQIRANSRNAYPEPENIAEICEIVDAYRLLVFPTDTEKGKELVARFHALLPKGDGSGSGEGSGEGGSTKIKVKAVGEGEEGDFNVVLNDPFGHGNRPHEGIESSLASRPQSPKQQKRDSDRASKLDQADDAELAEKMKSKPTIELDIDQVEFADEGDDEINDESSNGIGDELAELLQSTLNDILTSAEIATEIRDIMRQIGGLPSLATNDAKEPELDHFNSLRPDSKTVEASATFARELLRLKSSFDPAWETYESSGRLHAGRYLRGEDIETVFDSWNEGIEDACEIECVIILDNSGSMSGHKAENAYKAMYAIKRALDKINANTTVITFNSDTNLLYRAKDKATGVIRDAGAGGGTEPDKAIKYATKLLAETDKPVRIFFAITDGEWGGDSKANHDAIDRMARAGVLTAFAYIPYGSEQIVLDSETSHRCEIGAVINNPLDLIGMARKIVKYAITRRLVRN